MRSDVPGLDTAGTSGVERSPDRIVLDSRTIEELDAAICRLAGRLHAETYRLLTLIRDFDDRFGWRKWSFANCSEWLAWRCQISVSAAREKVRTAHALRG
ncbi:MAG TPA: HNH endonuclease, partial [Gammaproteobacteria bacterium]|nr:HNH endonuclease [Gammaproteobacteria bacterium]